MIDQRLLNMVYGLNYSAHPHPENPCSKWIYSNTSRNTAHSAGHSGRTSPADSNSGHKSS